MDLPSILHEPDVRELVLKDVCPTCHGNGFTGGMAAPKTCVVCRGGGEVVRIREAVDA